MPGINKTLLKLEKDNCNIGNDIYNSKLHIFYKKLSSILIIGFSSPPKPSLTKPGTFNYLLYMISILYVILLNRAFCKIILSNKFTLIWTTTLFLQLYKILPTSTSSPLFKLLILCRIKVTKNRFFNSILKRDKGAI